ncbi:hypothetical protein Misp01_32110 [Microtetraspora sp. NBRC 13810]|nr:hypothetical protein Misp01_32110 [Microtetraspora sp. NBRC 13810]
MAPADRFDYWWEAVSQSVISVDAASERADDFWGEMRMMNFGVVQLGRVRCNSFEARRTPRRIRQSDPGYYQMTVTLSGASGIRQMDREATMRPGEFVLYDTSRTFNAWTTADFSPETADNPVEGRGGLVLGFSRDVLPIGEAEIRRLLAVRLSGREDVGALLVNVLHRLTKEGERYAPEDAVRVSHILLDLLAATLTKALGEKSTASLSDPRQVLLMQVMAFIERHLDDGGLSPATIAAAHSISVRHLHRLFESQDVGVAGWIRRRRLERCRAELADPSRRRVTVRAIARRWGFHNEAHFSRTFSAAFGLSPTAYRRQAGQAGHPER